MYVKEERILRYAITNKISPVGGESNRDYMDTSPADVRLFNYKPDGEQSLEMIFTVELINTTILTPLAELGLM